MPRADHEREEQLFHACLELPPAERTAYLRQACRGDRQLQTRIERLVGAHERAEQATLHPLRDVLGALPDPDELAATGEGPPAGRAGDTVGPYRLVRLLAEGGMGSVWLAERSDQLVNRPIALKFPRGAWPSAGLAARMAREREILAAFSHPNIARLYDAGLTSDGQPYLALEYVEGRRIDEHCRDKGLGPKARLHLFLQVANAVAHAHAKLIVHRDLKPANILVTEDGQVRLLDFGIARLLEEGQARESEITKLSGRAFTLDYASPEQIAGEPITIGSDVYSLGVVLYELLAEARPYKPTRDSWGALEEAVLNVDPAPPSQSAGKPFRRALRGDLDTIVLKALKKKPADRYATVNAFVEDIDRYLRGLPVVAQPDRAWYRLSKFAGRNRLAVSAAAAVLVAVLAGAGVAVWQARVALAEKKRAEEVKEFITSIFRDADPYAAQGKTLSAAGLLKQAKGRIGQAFPARSEMRAELLSLVGSSLIGLEDYETAAVVLGEGAEDARRSLGVNHRWTLHLRARLADTYRYLGKTDSMREELRSLLPELRRNPNAFPDDLASAIKSSAHLAIDEGRYDEAQAAAQEALDLIVARHGEGHPDAAAASMLLAVSYQYRGTPELALPAAEHAYRMTLAAYGGNGAHPRPIDARGIYGRALANAGRFDEGIEQLAQAVSDAAALFGTTSPMVGYYSADLAKYRLETGDLKGAIESAEKAHAIITGLAQPGSFTHSAALHLLGESLLAARRAAAALPYLTQAAEGLGRARGPNNERTLTARALRSLALAQLGRADESTEELAGAVTNRQAKGDASMTRALQVLGVIARLSGHHGRALGLQQAALESMSEGPKAKRERVSILAEMGLGEIERGRPDQATSSLEEALRLDRELQGHPTPGRADALVGLGRARMSLGRPASALSSLEEADRFWRDFDPDNRWAGEAALWLGQCYSSLGRSREAREAGSRAQRILARSPMPTDARLVQLARRG